jgi:superfamily II DNA or RNA helicase
LRDDQKKAAQELLTSEMGILYAVPGFGKTVIGAFCISKRKANTLILVHRQQLLDQWKDRLSTFLELPPSSIGQIGGGKKKPTGIIDVAMVQSLNKKGVVDDLVAEYGQVIVDECHGVGSVEYEQVLRQVKAKWIVGLTATPVRYDGRHPIIVMQCGPIRYRIRHGDVDTGITEHIVLPRFTSTRLPEHAQHCDTQGIITELVNDEQRNRMIIDDILQCVKQKRMPLVLTKRKDHLQLLRERLEGTVKSIIIFHGGLSSKKRKALTEQLETAGDERIVLAIGQCIGEGFDDSRFDTLFLALPISFDGRLEQYVGRLHRAHEGKSVVKVYDYVDAHIEKMYRMFKKRQAGYKKIGYTMEMPL